MTTLKQLEFQVEGHFPARDNLASAKRTFQAQPLKDKQVLP
jgi:hypothetical protein